MNVWTGRFCLCMTLLCVGALSLAQEDAPRAEQPRPPQRPSPTEQPEELLLMQAMEHNPDIRTAKAEVAKAQAELEATQFRVAREVLSLRSEMKALGKILEKTRRRVDMGTASTDELIEVELRFLEAENQLQYLLGNVGGRPLGARPGGGGGFAGGFGGGGGRVGGFAAIAQMRIPQPRPEYAEGTPENLRKILEGPIGTTFEDVSLMVILDFIGDTYDINITVDLAFTPPVIRQIDLKNVPMRSALLALTDKMGDACFVIRDYGLFLTTRERAQTLDGVTIPEDVPYFAPIAPGQFQGGFGGGGGGFGGGGGGFGDGFAPLAQARMPQPRPAYEEGTTEYLRGILANPVSFTFTDISVMDIFSFLSDTYELDITVDMAFPPPTIQHITMRNVPMRRALLAFTDEIGDVCFVIRDYGLFLTTRERAQTLAGVTIPEDIPYFAPMPVQGGFGGGGGGGFGFGGGGGGFGGGGVGGFGGGGGGGSAGPGSAPGEAPAAPQEPSN